MQTQTKTNYAGGLFAMLIVLFLFGVFVGLPLVGWGLLFAAFVGLWVATAHQRAVESEQRPVLSDRPWQDHN